MNKNEARFSLRRRDFLVLLASIPLLSPASVLANRATNTNVQYTEEPWQTLDAVFEHLFPATDDAPGARDIRVISYMQTMLGAPDADPADRPFLDNGVGWLNDSSQTEYKQNFTALNETDRENILRKIETSNAGERWISLLLTYLIEALVSDPVYGSNPGGIGWQWLQHPPGYPLPTADSMYFKLGKRITRNTKA